MSDTYFTPPNMGSHMNGASAHAPIGVLLVDPGGTVHECNAVACELLECSRAEAQGATVEYVFPDSVEATVTGLFDTVPEREHVFEEYYPALERWLSVSVVPTDELVFVYVDDVTERYRDRRRIEQVRDDLERVTVLNGLISEVLADLMGAASREEIAETICRRLGETDLYEFAWVGERELGGDDLVVRAAVGHTGRTLEEIESCLEEATVPEERAIASGESVVVQPIGEDSRVAEPIRRAAFADGLQSLLAIPLTYGSNAYGVVGVYTTEQDAFSERERSSFETVGEVAGFAVNATRHRNLLLADTVVELDLQLTDPDAPFVGVADREGLSFDLEGFVPQGELLLCYVVVDDGSVERAADRLRAHEGIEAVRVISEQDGGGTLEVAVGSETPLGLLAATGLTVSGASYSADGGILEIECAPEDDVRRIVDELSRRYDVELLAKREREREVTTTREFRDRLAERLTERQEHALRTAFFADYFESPRGSTAEEVAAALDITGPTLLHHLRAGQRKLLAEFFDVADEE